MSYLFEVEALHALRRHNLGGVLPAERARLALNRLGQTRFIRSPHTPCLGQIWELRKNLTTYDAAYVALAEALKAPLVRTNARLAQAPGNHATVELYK